MRRALTRAAATSSRWAGVALAAPFRFYRLFLSPLKGPTCRFSPSCSAYAIEALTRHGAIYGGWLTLRRISRCHPFESLGAGSGCDPVPPARPKNARRRAACGDDGDA